MFLEIVFSSFRLARKLFEEDKIKAITFRIGAENFSLEIGYLKEIKPFAELKNTYVPNSPAWLEGLVNLRGILVPVINLGIAFNIKNNAGKNHNVIILSVRNRIIGILVDAIGTIMDINEGELEKPPSTMSKTDTKYISGVKRMERDLLVHLIPENLIEFGDKPRSDADKRLYPRKQTDISAHYYVINESIPNPQWTPCRILDISLGGFMMFLAEHLNVGTDVKICLLDGSEFDGVVAWSRELSEHSGNHTGLKFKEPPEAMEGKIKKLIER